MVEHSVYDSLGLSGKSTQVLPENLRFTPNRVSKIYVDRHQHSSHVVHVMFTTLCMCLMIVLSSVSGTKYLLS